MSIEHLFSLLIDYKIILTCFLLYSVVLIDNMFKKINVAQWYKINYR